MTNTCLEIVWLRYLLQDLKVSCNLSAQLFCDNRAALHIAENLVFHERIKHVEIDCHIVREKLQASWIISPSYVPTQYQLAYIFTKALGNEQFLTLPHKLGFMYFTYNLEGTIMEINYQIKRNYCMQYCTILYPIICN